MKKKEEKNFIFQPFIYIYTPPPSTVKIPYFTFSPIFHFLFDN